MSGLPRLRAFVTGFAAMLDRTADEAAILDQGGAMLRDLIGADDWLPEAYAKPDPVRYTQYLLHCDSRERFSVVSFVWGPGQSTPVHNHTVWGLVGVLRGAEVSQGFRLGGAGLAAEGAPHRLERGEVEAVSPRIGDIHQVSNAFDDAVSISIHVYGANIGAVQRAVFDPAGQEKPFISGYANGVLPNLWDASRSSEL